MSMSLFVFLLAVMGCAVLLREIDGVRLHSHEPFDQSGMFIFLVQGMDILFLLIGES